MLQSPKYYFHGKCCYCEERRLEIWKDPDYNKLGTYLHCCQNCGGLSNKNGIFFNLSLLTSVYLSIIEEALIPAAILLFSGIFYFLVSKNKPVANPEGYIDKIQNLFIENDDACMWRRKELIMWQNLAFKNPEMFRDDFQKKIDEWLDNL